LLSEEHDGGQRAPKLLKIVVF